MIRVIRGRDYSKYFKVRKDENGKPYLVNSHKHISISHTEKYTFIIISSKNVGIDVEKIRNVPDDLKSYLKINTNSKYKFFKEWTRREAMIKRDNLKLGNITELTKKGKFKTYLVYPYVITICR